MSDGEITVTGMVISATPVSDYDKRLVILTKERGKITAFVKGARRPGSSMLAAANPFAFGEFTIYPGRNAYTASKARITEYFRDLAVDYEAACYGFYFLEVADYYSRENEDDRELLKLLYITINVLSQKRLPLKTLQHIFELRMLVVNGESPRLDGCVKCNKKEDLHYFNAGHGGLVCDDCVSKIGGNSISQSALYTMQYVVSAPLTKLYTFTLTPEVEKEFFGHVNELKKVYMRHPFKSLDVI